MANADRTYRQARISEDWHLEHVARAGATRLRKANYSNLLFDAAAVLYSGLSVFDSQVLPIRNGCTKKNWLGLVACRCTICISSYYAYLLHIGRSPSRCPLRARRRRLYWIALGEKSVNRRSTCELGRPTSKFFEKDVSIFALVFYYLVRFDLLCKWTVHSPVPRYFFSELLLRQDWNVKFVSHTYVFCRVYSSLRQ